MLRSSRMGALASLLVVLWLGCSGVPTASPEAQAESKRFEPPPGRALVYIIRKPALNAAATNVFATIDGYMIGALPMRHYAAVKLDPGLHTVGVKWQANAALTEIEIDVEADAVYFVAVYMTGGMAHRPEVRRITETEGHAYVMEYKMIESL